jgi:hypothetical protein
MLRRVQFRRRHVDNGFQQSAIAVSVDPLQFRAFDGINLPAGGTGVSTIPGEFHSASSQTVNPQRNQRAELPRSLHTIHSPPIANRFRNLAGRERFNLRQICDRPRHLEHAVIATRNHCSDR